MKNYLTLVLGVMIVASPAFASRARLEALGEGKDGSYYIQDSRNIFLNPAAINNYKKKLWLELGTAGTSTDVNTQTAPTGTAGNRNDGKVQGGFTNTFGDFTYGLYFSKESDRALSAVTAASALVSSATFTAPDHAIDFFFGGESGLKWGANVFWAGAQNKTLTVNSTSSMIGARLGVDINAFQVFTTIGINSNAKSDTGVSTTTAELKGKTSIDAGLTYAWEDMTFFGKFSTFGTELGSGTTAQTGGSLGIPGIAGATSSESNTMAYGLGAGWKKEASKTVTMYSRVEWSYQKNTYKAVAPTTIAGEFGETWWNVPVVVGAEAQALSWLTVRGSLAHSLFGQHNYGTAKDSLNNMTTIAAGLGLTFGDVMIDGLVATDGTVANTATRGVYGVPGMNQAQQSNTTFGFGNNMISRLAVTYNF